MAQGKPTYPWSWSGTGEPPTTPPWGPVGRDLTLGVVATASKLWLQLLNRTTCQGCDRLRALVVSRPPGRPLVTVSNHMSTLDDPTVLSAMMPLSLFFTESRHGRMRWTLCANDMCHINKLLCNFFLSGKTLPIVRGAGHHQPVLDLVARQLRDRGDWLHVFPEGRVRQDGQMNPLKSGLASILCDVADKGPIVVPFHHSGMQDVIRAHTARPRVNNRIRIAVGEPIPLEDLLAKCRKKGVDQRQLARDIMERVASSLEELRRLNAEAAQRGD